MKRHSFSSRHTGHIGNLRKQRQKYPAIADQIVEISDIILEVLDARFIEKTRNLKLEEQIKNQNKNIIYVLNKADLVSPKTMKENTRGVYPYVAVSCKNREGIKKLRDLIKRISKGIKKSESEIVKKGKVVQSEDNKIHVGIIGYPNTGKSSLINLLIGKSGAGVGSDAGFTKNIQKLKLTPDIMLFDSPGVIPESEYSHTESEKVARHTIVGSRSYSQVKEPELVIAKIMEEYPGVLEKYYNIQCDRDSEELLEQLGKQKGFLKKGGEVNEDTTARFILKEWQAGKIFI